MGSDENGNRQWGMMWWIGLVVLVILVCLFVWWVWCGCDTFNCVTVCPPPACNTECVAPAIPTANVVDESISSGVPHVITGTNLKNVKAVYYVDGDGLYTPILPFFVSTDGTALTVVIPDASNPPLANTTILRLLIEPSSCTTDFTSYVDVISTHVY